MSTLSNSFINESVLELGQEITKINFNNIVYNIGKDRNTVGVNDAIGITTSSPTVALNKGLNYLTAKALDGNNYMTIKVPDGYYNGKSYVGVSPSSIPNLIPANIKWGIIIGGVTGTSESFISTYGNVTSSSTKVGFKDITGVTRNYYYITVPMDTTTGNCVPAFFTAQRTGGEFKRMEFFTDLWNGFIIDYDTGNTCWGFALENNNYFKWNSETVQIPVLTPGVTYQWSVAGRWYKK